MMSYPVTPTSSVDGFQVSCTAKPEVAVATTPAGTEGGVVSPIGPSRLVPKAASSKATSYTRPAWVSPIWSWPTGARPVSMAVLERSAMRMLSSHTSTTPVAPAVVSALRWSSRACQPGFTTVALIVLTPVVSSWKASCPVASWKT